MPRWEVPSFVPALDKVVQHNPVLGRVVQPAAAAVPGIVVQAVEKAAAGKAAVQAAPADKREAADKAFELVQVGKPVHPGQGW